MKLVANVILFSFLFVNVFNPFRVQKYYLGLVWPRGICNADAADCCHSKDIELN